MRTGAALALLAAVSLGLTAWRHAAAPDVDDRFQAGLAAALAGADILVVGVEETPALRLLRLRRIGCTAERRLGFAPDDGEAEAALRRLLPGGAALRLPSADPRRPGWIVVAEGPADRGCIADAALGARLRHPFD